MVTIQAVCNEIINRSIKENTDLTPLKLQKLTYFIYAYGLAKYNQKFFNADFYAWRYGPVCESIYHEFKGFGCLTITKFAQDANGVSYVPDWDSLENNDLLECLNTIWEKYGKTDGSDLVSYTHKPHSAWSKTMSNQRIQDEDMIKDVLEGLY